MKNSKGFTLIELLVVIAIIGLLSTVIFVSLNSAREKAKIAKSAAQLRQLQKMIAFYFDDTDQLPSSCRLDCTAATDPFLNALGVFGWHGPYVAIWNLAHPWGGHLGFGTSDWDSDGDLEGGFIMDDDQPGTDDSNNQGVIPVDSLIAIDKILDDGNLATGSVRGNALGFNSAVGELVMAFKQ